MSKKLTKRKAIVASLGMFVPLFVFGLLAAMPAASAQSFAPGAGERAGLGEVSRHLDLAALQAPDAACAGGPTIDGILLDECYIETFTVGGTSKSIRVWYTKNPVTATRMVDGSPVVLSHWIDTDAQAEQVAEWGRDAWERYYEIFGRHPYDTGCSNRINVQMEDGIGWGGIAYWASSGNCNIGIDSPMVRGGGGQWTVYHEFQHYLQYAFDDGCYGFLQANYDGGSAAGDAEFVEGYADLGADAVDGPLDASGYGGAVSGDNPTMSMYDKSYGNVYNKYFMEQVGSEWTPADPHHHMDAIREHYLECDDQDTLYVLDTVIPAQLPGMSEELLYLDFFAANWAKDWADAATQPELVYTDDDGNAYGSANLAQNVTISGGSQSWAGESTPDDWAGQYYQVRPQTGCPYVTADVNGASGANLGINLMAADTSAPTHVLRSAWIGEDFVRTFAGAGVHDRVVAAVNAFATVGNYDVTFTCVTPALNLLEPKQTNFALVGDPASPIAFLARFEVTSGGAPVLGLPAASFTATAEGDVTTILTGTLQAVGEEYWAIMMPPTKTVGTTFVDLTVCLDGSVCDTETDALLYVDPGNTDFALVFDASGSMATEDIIGEGTRLVNAKKAGTVLADLLRNGDRVLVTDFSAIDSPPGCGLPGGDGNCPLDIQLRLARTDVVVPGTITATKNAINLITAREWTPIGAALEDAKDRLLAAPFSLNPKHIVLLSDGEENVNPLYADVRDELIDSGVVIDTIGFSGEAPAALLAQISADTGGTYRFVPTSPGTLVAPDQADLDRLAAQGVPPEIINRIQTAQLPGPLGLDDVYDYYETKSQGASRLFHLNHLAVAGSTWVYSGPQYVDGSVNALRLVVATKQADYDYLGCAGDYRLVEVRPPNPEEPQRPWIPISPRSPAITPADWDVRNSLYDDVVIITNPDVGFWEVRALMEYCIGAASEQPAAPTVAPYDFMMNGSVESNIRLQGRFLAPIINNQGTAGDMVPIVATLLSRTGALPGAAVVATVEKPGATNVLTLWDDGAHSDGAADDGIYGAFYNQTTVGGSYNVRLLATWPDPATGNELTREWLGTFYIDGPSANDEDKDGIPDDWEIRCKLDPSVNDAQFDLDQDGLSNYAEFLEGTLPCDPDTDNGGERDGSEVVGNRDPLNGRDDFVSPLRHFSFEIFNQGIVIRWAQPLTYTHLLLYLSTDPTQLGQEMDIGNSGVYSVTGLINDQPYYLTLAAANSSAEGAYSDTSLVIPKSDPDPPSGAMLINNGVPGTVSKNVVLNISSTDEPLPGVAQSANAHLGSALGRAHNTVSAGVEMRVSNDPSFAGAVWEPLAFVKPWTLGDAPANIYRVYIQFRDAAGNESFVVFDDIALYRQYLPLMFKQ